MKELDDIARRVAKIAGVDDIEAPIRFGAADYAETKLIYKAAEWTARGFEAIAEGRIDDAILAFADSAECLAAIGRRRAKEEECK